MLRFIKYLAIAFGLIIGGIVLLVAVSYFFPPTYEAATALPDSDATIIVQLVPMHPVLAEYRRYIVLRKTGTPDQRIDMFPDTGGYSRTQLYRISPDIFVVRGFFDSVKIDLKGKKLISERAINHVAGVYLGAFDNTNHDWRFIPAIQSPEQPLVASGG